MGSMPSYDKDSRRIAPGNSDSPKYMFKGVDALDTRLLYVFMPMTRAPGSHRDSEGR